MPEVKPRRHYNAEGRQRQAAATRAGILEAARRIFIERGYGGATMEAIAEDAGVATITVYSVFRSKRALLAQLVSAAVSGDRSSAPIYEQDRAQAIMREPDQQQQLKLFSAHMAEVMERVSPLFEVLDHAAAVEPEIAKLRKGILLGRMEGMRAFVGGLARQGRLRISDEEAAQAVWAVTAPQLFRLLTLDLAWSSDRWAGWVAAILTAALLPPRG